MAKTKVTNKSEGPRGFNIQTPAGGMRQVVLMPGESGEFDLDGAAHPALAGHIRTGDLVLGEVSDQKAQAEADAMMAEAEAKKQDDAVLAEMEAREAREKAAAEMEAEAQRLQEERDADLQAQVAGTPRMSRRERAATVEAAPATPTPPVA